VAIGEEVGGNIGTSAESSPGTEVARGPGHHGTTTAALVYSVSQMMENVRGLERGPRSREITSIRFDFCQASRIFSRSYVTRRNSQVATYGLVIGIYVSITVLINIVPKNTLISTAVGFYSRTTALKESLLETRTRYNLGTPKQSEHGMKRYFLDIFLRVHLRSQP
jgi:hypothetical protein